MTRSRKHRDSLFGADAALAALVIVVVGLMIIPLPTWALDLLISTNLSAAVVILLVVLYVPDAIGIATFPTLLLLTTLFRLALNVASTRLILLQANAGEVIKAFGTFVVRGNYVVGAVVFLVLTTIQFIVIAKGSERVAEVGARFALDAMPGKQMAIDAELRAGSMDGNEAKRRRRLLQRESQFYGAMDGAMKFVKRDFCLYVGGRIPQTARKSSAAPPEQPPLKCLSFRNPRGLRSQVFGGGFESLCLCWFSVVLLAAVHAIMPNRKDTTMHDINDKEPTSTPHFVTSLIVTIWTIEASAVAGALST